MEEAEEIIRKCRNGDRSALAALYKAYSDKMLKVCLDIVKDRDAAQDLLHDGFIIIFTSVGSLRETGRLESWMRRIMTNLSIKYLNGHGRFVPLCEDDYADAGEDSVRDAAAVPLDELMKMIDRLPEGYRNVFRLSVLEGLSHNDIAVMLGIEPNTSSSQLLRARRKLQRMVAEYNTRLVVFTLMALMSFFSVMLDDTVRQHVVRHVTVGSGVPDYAVAGTESCDCEPSMIKDAMPEVPHKNMPDVRTAVPMQKLLHTDTLSVIRESVLTALNCVVADSAVVANTPLPDTFIAAEGGVTHGNLLPNRHNDLLFGLCSVTEQASGSLLPRIIEVIDHSVGSATRVQIETWEQLAHYLTYDVGDDIDPVEKDALMRIALVNNGKILTRKDFEKPLQLGLSFSKILSERWSLDTGLRFTRHTANMLTGSSDTTNISERQRVYFVGLPVNVNYTFMRYGKFSLYGSVGFAIDIPFRATSEKNYNIDGHINYHKKTGLQLPELQWSLNAGAGISYEIAPHVELFFSPKATWYIPDNSNTETQWHDKPLQLSFPFGIRLKY